MTTLGPKDRALLIAHYTHGKTIQEIAQEQELRWSTVGSHLLRIVRQLRKRIVPTAIMFVLLWTKKARAHVGSIVRQLPTHVGHAVHATAVMAVPVMGGAFFPTAEPLSPDPPAVLGLAPSTSGSSIPTLAGQVKPNTTDTVAPVKLFGVDTGENPWSPPDMNANLLRRFVQQTVFPTALVVVPATSSSACASTAAQPPPQEEPEKYDDFTDPYVAMCLHEQLRGTPCVTREEWYRSIGYKGDKK